MVAEATYQDGDDQWTTSDTQLQWHWHAWDGEWKATEDDTYHDADEDGGDVWCIQTLDGVTHHLCHTIYVLLRTYYQDSITYMEVVVSACEDVHALSRDASYIDAIHAGEVHLAQGLTVHLWSSNDDSLAHEVLNLVFLTIPFSLYLRTDEGLDSLCVGFCTYHQELVAYLEGGLAVRNAHLALVEESGANDVTVQEL